MDDENKSLGNCYSLFWCFFGVIQNCVVFGYVIVMRLWAVRGVSMDPLIDAYCKHNMTGSMYTVFQRQSPMTDYPV